MKTATTLGQEVKRLNREMAMVIRHDPFAPSVPIRIHSRETDAGGAPEWHPAFSKWIDAERDLTKRSDRFYESDKKQHTSRMKRALRQLRRLAPKEHDAMYLMIALGYTWYGALAKMNDDNVARGKPEYTEAEFLVLTVSGSSLLLASY